MDMKLLLNSLSAAWQRGWPLYSLFSIVSMPLCTRLPRPSQSRR